MFKNPENRNAAIFAGALFLIASHLFAYLAGGRTVQADWDKSRLSQISRAAAVQIRQANTEKDVVIQYVDRVKTVRVQGETLIREVPKYVPIDSCALPGGFRLLHDAAASGSELPSPASGADAAPIPAQDAAETIVANYTDCRENAERLMALQNWVLEMKKAADWRP